MNNKLSDLSSKIAELNRLLSSVKHAYPETSSLIESTNKITKDVIKKIPDVVDNSNLYFVKHS